VDTLIKAREVAPLLRLSESTIYKLVATGEIPGFKIGGSWRFALQEIEKMIQKTGQKNSALEEEG
jgi:excisionase family DNA binding protein